MRVFIVTKRRLCVGLAICLSMLMGLGVGMHAALSSSAKGERLLPIYSVQTEENKICLTFDVAWGNSDVDEILSILEANGAKATFFTTGEWVDRYPEDVQKMLAGGHDVQSHSDKHPHVAKIGADQLRADTQACADKLLKLTGTSPKYYRAPYGEYDNEMMQTLSDYQVIQWDVDSRDWKPDATVESIVKNATTNVKPGSILLFHVDAKAKNTAKALEQLLPTLTGQYQCVLLDDLVLTQNYTIDHAGKQIPVAT